MMRYVLLSVLMVFSVNAVALSVTILTKADINDWQQKSFKGNTIYSSSTLNGETVLRADSAQSASILVKSITVDLTKTPYLNWRWRIENRLNTEDETSKQNDDYAARIYVVNQAFLFWQTKALNYVWSNGKQKGEVWANAFAGDNVKMLSLRDKGDNTTQWYSEKRNVLADLKQYFADDDINEISEIAIMTDTDNAGGEAVAYYADIYFSAE